MLTHASCFLWHSRQASARRSMYHQLSASSSSGSQAPKNRKRPLQSSVVALVSGTVRCHNLSFIIFLMSHLPAPPSTRQKVSGFLIGGVFVQLTTWRWILWFTGIFGLGTGALALVILPPSAPRRNKPSWRKLDLGGVAAITGAIILFVYGITTGPIDGWDSGNCLAPLIISIILGAAFFAYEARIPADTAALPPKVWRYPNVPVLFAVGFAPYFWWSSGKRFLLEEVSLAF
jgi:hypothetical protein